MEDPNGVNGSPTGPIPPDENPLNDPNFMGVFTTPGTSIEFPKYADGATYYIAPFAFDNVLQIFDPVCTGLASGYTIYMNPPLNTSISAQ